MARKPETMNRTVAGTTGKFVTLLAALMLVLSACGGELEVDETVQMARADWSSGHMQAAIYAQLIEELGYAVTDPADATLNPNQFYNALAAGQYDLWANGWFPLHDIYLKGELVTGQSTDLPIEPVGFQVASGGLQGYMIDKATADALGITSMDDLIANAGAFDRDGNGKADLIGCPDGWGCNTAIGTHIAEFGWGGSVEQMVGSSYDEPVRDAQSRLESGESVLFYGWTPNWTMAAMPPGEDVVWLQSPALPEDDGSSSVPGLQGCAYDPCNLGWAVSSIRAVANTNFLDDNPQIRRLLEVVAIPLNDISAQNAKMAAGDYSDEQIEADAASWIADNRAMVDGWLATARGG